MIDELPPPVEFARIDIIESLDDSTLFDVVGVNYEEHAIVNTVLARGVNRQLAESFVRVYCDNYWESVL